MQSLAEVLATVPDHRSLQGQRHRLSALLLFMCTGMLCGCGSLQALTVWGKRQERVPLKSMGFKRGQAPGYGTLQRLVSRLNVEAFEAALNGWAKEVLQAQGRRNPFEELAVDGKVLRGSRQGSLPGVHLLSLVAQELGITLAQQVTSTTNEAKAVVPLLLGLSLTNCLVTGDAAFMQREVCQLIIKQQGHYLIVLKDNQPELRQTVQDWFEPFPPPDEYQMQHSQAISLGHGRIERRELWALHVYDDFLDWPGARLMLRLERTVIHKNTGLLRRELAYALSSLDLDSVGADKILLGVEKVQNRKQLRGLRHVVNLLGLTFLDSGGEDRVLMPLKTYSDQIKPVTDNPDNIEAWQTRAMDAVWQVKYWLHRKHRGQTDGGTNGSPNW